MTDWIVETVDVSPVTDGLAITGINTCTSDDLSRRFSWDVGHHSIESDRYDWSNALWGPGAKARFNRLVRLSKRSRGGES